MKISNHPLHYSIHTRLRKFHFDRLLSGSNKNGIILDIGCGLGYWLDVYGDDFAINAGIDSDDVALKANIANGHRNMMKGDASRLPFKNNSVDVIICSEVLEHLEDGLDQNALCEMDRVLKSDGKLLLTVPALEGINAYTKMRNLGHDKPGGEFHYRPGYALNEIKKLISNTSLEIRETHFSMFLLSEMFMDIQKWFFYKKSGFKEHSDILNAKDSSLFRIYQSIFPIMILGFILEDIIICPYAKGHILIMLLNHR
jgi:SAM-dependent methyltransferase